MVIGYATLIGVGVLGMAIEGTIGGISPKRKRKSSLGEILVRVVKETVNDAYEEILRKEAINAENDKTTSKDETVKKAEDIIEDAVKANKEDEVSSAKSTVVVEPDNVIIMPNDSPDVADAKVEAKKEKEQEVKTTIIRK
jgi:hypothetical protein